MARILSILEKIMLFKLLAFIILQGVLTCDALVKPEGIGSGGVPHSRAVSGGSGTSEAAEPKSRPKRCTCYSYKDKECVYYCHLDIIWINTPERTVPYGMSSYQGPQRIRRAVVGRPTERQGAKTQRCICVLDADPKCQDFCLSRQTQCRQTGLAIAAWQQQQSCGHTHAYESQQLREAHCSKCQPGVRTALPALDDSAKPL